MRELLISEIWIYPIKSLGGIRLSSAKVLPKGIEYDRRWMLIDAENNFMTQRVFPSMALFKLSFVSGRFVIRYADDTIDLPFTYQTEPLQSQIWDDSIEVYEVSSSHSEWFSERLGMNCRLVSFPDTNQRPIDPRYASNNEQVSLADGYPLLVVGQASLDDLNQRMNEPLPMNRFRPNIVFTGGEPYEEDGWKNFRIGANRFAGVKPCARCVLTTVDQDTAVKGIEPLTTLATYRRIENKVYFGQNLIPLNYNQIAEGDPIVFE